LTSQRLTGAAHSRSGERIGHSVRRVRDAAVCVDVATPEHAARRAFDGLIAAEPYIVTHGDLVDAVAARCHDLRRAAESVT
jgi:Ni2+-binding GTPase involved in maturation of urease and hydrogenase